ncbi:MAG TPA: hypothetical protein VKV23_03400 [Acidimicrobiales bacterium]|nr:hypothetical protein [Acidimicrobiales bacterium]
MSRTGHALRRPALLEELRDPLFRNGHALVLSSMATSAIGMAFWVLAARGYPAADVGRDAAALSTMTFLGGVAQLNLTSALTRFIPTAGRKILRFVVSSYALAVVVAVVLALGFALLVPELAGRLDFIRRDHLMVVWWTLATAVWAIFVLEDGALTGLRRAPWVPVENAGFSLLKAGLVLPFAASFKGAGIFVAWTLASLATVVPTNLYLFGRAIPRQQRRSPEGDVRLHDLVRYVPYDYLASLCWLTATLLLPLLVIEHAGPAVSAAFSLSWVIAYALYLVSINIGLSLVVETAADARQLGPQCRRVIVHLTKLLVPAVAVVVAGAPAILSLFGRSYAATGTTTLRLLALSSLPFIVNSTAVGALRVQRRTRLVFLLDLGLCASVIGLTAALLDHLGIAAAGLAWLVAQCAVAAIVLPAFGRVLFAAPARAARPRPVAAARLGAARLLVRRSLPDLHNPLRRPRQVREARRLASRLLPQLVSHLPLECLGTSRRIAELHVAPSASDLTVLLLQSPARVPLAVVKVPRSDRALAELLAEQRVLEALGSDDRLRAFRSLLPAPSLQGDGEPSFVVQPALPGVSARLLVLGAPWLRTRVARAGLQAIASLHAATAAPRLLDDTLLDGILTPKLDLLARTHPRRDVPVAHADALERLGSRLRDAARGKVVRLSWTHGDFTPGNVLLAPDALRVTGVLDWGQANPHGLAELDVLAWVGTLYCETRRCQLGELVRRVLAEPDWPDDAVLGEAAPAVAASPIDHRELVLWTWLNHVAGNLQKSRRYHRHALWWASNVEPVLEAVLAR